MFRTRLIRRVSASTRSGHTSAASTRMPSNKDTVEIDVLQYLSDSDHSLESLNKYPSVKKLFMRYSTALPSSATVERLYFSFVENIHSPKRNKLSDKMFETLVILKGNSLYLNRDRKIRPVYIGPRKIPPFFVFIKISFE